MGSGTFYFGPFRLVVAKRRLFIRDTLIVVGDRAFDLLLALLRHAGETLGPRELTRRAWPDASVAPGTFRAHLANLRRALGDGRHGARFIVSVRRRGYCLAVPVRCRGRSTLTRGDGSFASEGPFNAAGRPIRRDECAAALSSHLVAGRFIALGGPGGLGRPMLAVTVARSLIAYFGDDICLVNLASAQNAAEVLPRITAALGCLPDPDDPAYGLAAFLARRKFLLVLDCCEHVIDTVAALMGRLFREAPLLHILATSHGVLPRLSARVHSN